MKLRFHSVLAAVVLSVIASTGAAEEGKIPFPPAKTIEEIQQPKMAPVAPEPIGPGRYRIGEIVLDKTDRSVTFPATINMNEGLLEYLLVGASGKTHESLLRTHVEPYALQVACLLVGLEGTSTPLSFQGDPRVPKGDGIDISIRVQGGDSSKAVKPEKWLLHTVGDAKQPVSKVRWIFTGSMVNSGRFAAQMTGSIVALYHDPAAMVDNASPGGENDKVWFVRSETTPPVGTPVVVTFRSKK